MLGKILIETGFEYMEIGPFWFCPEDVEEFETVEDFITKKIYDVLLDNDETDYTAEDILEVIFIFAVSLGDMDFGVRYSPDVESVWPAAFGPDFKKKEGGEK